MPFRRSDFWHFVRDGWDRVAPRYVGCWEGATGLYVEPLLDAAGVSSGRVVLDLACGTGIATQAAARRGARAIGVDVAPAMVALARRRFPNLRFEEADAHVLPLSDGELDAVVMNFGILHLADPGVALGEMRRVLRPGGRLAFTVWAGPDRNPHRAALERALAIHKDASVGSPPGPEATLFADPEVCRRTLASAGFDVATLSNEAVERTWLVPSAGFFFEAELDAGVRTAALLATLSPQALAAVRADVEKSLARFLVPDGCAIPLVAHVVAVAAPAAGPLS